jgi:hypothetical protein
MLKNLKILFKYYKGRKIHGSWIKYVIKG